MFKPEDVSKYCAGMTLTPAQADEWLKVANEAMAISGGVDELDAEIAAIKTANATFRKASAKFSDRSHPYEATLSEVSLVDTADGFQKVLPVGYWFNDFYGDLVFTKTYMDRLVKNWQDKALGNRQPFLDTDHDGGAANAWAVALEARDDGLYVKWDWTEKGRQLVNQKIYRYYSATLQEALNVKTGEMVYPVLSGVSLTNRPAMNTMPDAHLSESRGAHGDPAKSAIAEVEEIKMELKDVTEFMKNATPEDKAALIVALGVKNETPAKLPETALEKALVQLSEQVNGLQSQLADMKDKEQAKGEDDFIKASLSDGKILPVDEDFWRKQFRDNEKGTREIVEKLPKRVDFSVRGVAGRSGDVRFGDKERKLARKFNPKLDEKKVDKLINGAE